MKRKVFRKMNTNEFVSEDDSREYALTELGLMKNGELVIIPKGVNGQYTLEQLDNIEETVEWFYSGNWYEDEIEEDEEIEQYEPNFSRTKNDCMYDYWRQENAI